MGTQQISVLIAGAGPTGLTLGCELARRGVAFRLVDKAAQYFHGSRGKGLQPRSLEVMDDLGVIDRILELGRFHLPFRGYEGGKVIGEQDMHTGRYPTPSTPYASPMIIPQWRVEETLRGLLERLGGRVELATELVGLEQDAEGGDCDASSCRRFDRSGAEPVPGGLRRRKEFCTEASGDSV